MEKLKLELPDGFKLYEHDYQKQFLKAKVTDFATLQETEPIYDERVGGYWLQPAENMKKDEALVMNCNGFIVSDICYNKANGIRPATSYSLIKKYFSKENILSENVTESEIGLFPKSVPSQKMQKEIKEKIKQNVLCKTSFSVPNCDYNGKINKLNSYIYQGKVYTLCKTKTYKDRAYETTSGQIFVTGEEAVIENAPIKLINFPKEDLTLFKDIIMGGFYFDRELYNYMNNYLAPYILKSNKFNIAQANYKNAQRIVSNVQEELKKLQFLINDTYLMMPEEKEKNTQKKKKPYTKREK